MMILTHSFVTSADMYPLLFPLYMIHATTFDNIIGAYLKIQLDGKQFITIFTNSTYLT